MNKTIGKIILALVAAFAFSVSANAVTFVVNTTNDTLDATPGNGICADSIGNCSLRAAIGEANALAGADIITLPAGTYTTTIPTTNENANLNGDFDILSPITINGTAPAGATIIQANAAPNTATDRVIHCVTGGTPVVINDVTIRNGNLTVNSSGGGLRVETGGSASITLNRVVITDNKTAGAGGGINFINAGVTFNATDCTISNNSAGSAIAGSGVTGAGINIQVAGTFNLTNTIVSGNNLTSAVGNTFGGGIDINPGAPFATVTLTGCTVNNNSSNATGAAFAGIAGGIYNQASTLTLTNTTVSGNSCTGPAGGVQAGVRTLAQNTPATTTITNCTISGNMAVEEGAGVQNIAVGTAACITNITGSTISGNTASAANSIAGGIENFNISTGAATVNLSNSTISGNTAAFAAGVYFDGTAATVNCDYTTIASNTATVDGGGFYRDVDGGTANLKNSILADNTAGGTGPDMFGTVISQDYNHVENTSGGTFAAMPNDVVGTDPQLGPLAANGGPTMTHLPGAGSPVLNTIANGTSGCGTTVTVDQRGLPRPAGAGCEKGSVEVQTASPLTANSAVSRQTHGGTGDFDVNLPLVGSPGIECRNGAGSYLVIISFSNDVVSGNASVTTGTGVAGAPTFSANTMSIPLTGVTDVQQIEVTATNVTDVFAQVLPSVPVPMIMLIGDSAGTGNGTVNAGDIGFVKSQSGVAVGAGNFRADIAINGAINAGDIGLVKSKSGNHVP